MFIINTTNWLGYLFFSGLWRKNLRSHISRALLLIVLIASLRSTGPLPLIRRLWRRLSSLLMRLWGGEIYLRLACYEQWWTIYVIKRDNNIFTLKRWPDFGYTRESGILNIKSICWLLFQVNLVEKEKPFLGVDLHIHLQRANLLLLVYYYSSFKIWYHDLWSCFNRLKITNHMIYFIFHTISDYILPPSGLVLMCMHHAYACTRVNNLEMCQVSCAGFVDFWIQTL